MEKFGGGQEFTQAEKTKLSKIGNSQKISTANASISVPANTITKINEFNLESGHLYVCGATVGFNPSSSTAGYLILDLNYVLSEYGQKRVSYYFPADTKEHRINICAYLEGSSTWGKVVLGIKAPTAGTVMQYEFFIAELN